MVDIMHMFRMLVFSLTMTWLKFRYIGEQVGWLELPLQVQSISDPCAHVRKSDDTNLMKWTLAEVPSCQIFIVWKDNVIICCITLMAFRENPRSVLPLFRCEAPGITNKLSTVRFEVITGVLLRMEVFWDMTLCHWASGFWYFTGLWGLHFEGTSGPVYLDSLVLKTRELWSFKTSGHLSQEHSITFQKPEILS